MNIMIKRYGTIIESTSKELDKLNSLMKSYGYILNDVSNQRNNKRPRLGLAAINRKYTPEIFDEATSSGHVFKVVTTSYGTLEVQEIDKVIKGYQNAVDLIDKLNRFDYSNVREEDFII